MNTKVSSADTVYLSFLGDYIGLALCLFSLLPQAMIVSILTLVVFRRDLHTVSTCLVLALFHTLVFFIRASWADHLLMTAVCHATIWLNSLHSVY